MDDFGFKLQNIKNKWRTSVIFKVSLLLLAAMFIIFIFAKMINALRVSTAVDIDDVPVIRSEVDNIKKFPTGLQKNEVEKMNVYNIVENAKDSDVVPIFKNERNPEMINQEIDEEGYDIFADQKSLAEKIEELTQDEVVENPKTEPDEKSLPKKPIQSVNSAPKKETSKIENINALDKKKKEKEKKKEKKEKKEKIISTDPSDLSKLGNKSLLNNLKKQKHIKPTTGIRVQLFAMKNRDTLIEYWKTLKNKYGALLDDKNYYVERVVLDNVGAMHRLQLGDFANESEAEEFCDEYTSATNKDKLDCILVRR